MDLFAKMFGVCVCVGEGGGLFHATTRHHIFYFANCVLQLFSILYWQKEYISSKERTVVSVAEWIAGWTTWSAIQGSIPSPAAAEIAISNSALGDYLIGHCCHQCQPRLNTWEVETLAMDPAGNNLFHSNRGGGGFHRISMLNMKLYLYFNTLSNDTLTSFKSIKVQSYIHSYTFIL